MRFHIDTMTCGGCVKSVTKAIQAVDTDAMADIDLGTKLVCVTSRADEIAIATVLDDVGYPPRRAA
ncbi:heavy-metal-associated domain-containing protein [Pelagibacterium lentulum]|uniref:Heavy metal-associated domain-containing protein n=1 Tax=Pelagibacterium lentulum TaxID=2029865 RepID=A0A916REQ7_9HYPH|nr:heavy-metal-associated domain-containing protein [Pelagibacterium lentulum]GGA53777.1 heavy metal-associated domain-containing protein [Pelagibacterium lentulum]